MKTNELIVRDLGKQDYTACWRAMRDFTDKRTDETTDELWLLEHAPVFTQGQNGKPEHILQPGDIPVVNIDRGGQVTYHGPGQLVAYTLIDIKRKKLNIREFVTVIEKSIINVLSQFNITAYSECKAPGVYIDGKKICSIGLRVRRGCAYHGLAFNINMNLEPFNRINPCGYKELQMTQLKEFVPTATINTAAQTVIESIVNLLGYDHYQFFNSHGFSL